MRATKEEKKAKNTVFVIIIFNVTFKLPHYDRLVHEPIGTGWPQTQISRFLIKENVHREIMKGTVKKAHIQKSSTTLKTTPLAFYFL